MNRIRKLRKAHGFNQAAFSQLLGVSQAALSGYETGKHQADYSILLKIADLFDVSVDYLLGKSDIKKAPNAEALSATPEAQALREVMESLSPEDRQRVLEFGRNLAMTAQKPKQQP